MSCVICIGISVVWSATYSLRKTIDSRLKFGYKMVEPDRSETDEGDMDNLQLSSDSNNSISPKKKRLRVDDSEDETNLPAKKRQSSFSERSKILNDNTETISDQNNTDGCKVKEKRYTKDVQKLSLSELNMDEEYEEKQDGKLKEENGNKSSLDENNTAMNKNPAETNIKEEIVESEDGPFQKSAANTSVISTPERKKVGKGDKIIEEEIDKTIDSDEESEEDGIDKQRTAKRCIVDTEVVDGLELSVECASDKEEPSSESEDEKDTKPRSRTVIIKAEPNESELDCSSEGEKSDSRQVTDTLEIKSEKSRTKRRGLQTFFSKLKASGSENSLNSNSDEDYNPRTKKKMKKSPITKRSTDKHRSVDSKRGRGRGIRRNSHKQYAELDKDDAHATVAERAKKTMKTKNRMEEELSEKESSGKNESDNSEKEERSAKDRRKRRNNTKPENKHIRMLKKYLKIAGVKMKSYNDIWADCKSNAAKIKRLKELLEKNGLSGRPTIEKCKRLRKENEEMRELSELAASNIISEGRVTRARRNMENVKKTPPDTPPRHREARNTFRRIQTVVDSDSE